MHDQYSRRLTVIHATHPRAPHTVNRPDSRLELALYDYHVFDANESALTLVLTHGTSFSKDLWHIIIDFLITSEELQGLIRRVVSIDAVNHGDSALLNKDKLGTSAFWPDNAYDILTTIQSLGLSQPIVGIGHSFGGGILAHAALLSRNSFAASIFVDPILFVMPEQDRMAADAALRRKNVWSSLDEVRNKFDNSKGLADWHPSQRQIYAEKGTSVESATEEITTRTMKTPKEQEAATYVAGPLPGILELLRRSTGRHSFILGGQSLVLNKSQRDEIREAAGIDKPIHLIRDAGHLIPMTHPFELAKLIQQQLLAVIIAEGQGSASHKL
ncbi:hypothetical protein G6011_10136 [Alternaria panax]|uniref:AB hydrolase-1 domain-containing protein n=1 Tax=Alternaria panax TaxID=48097 RepID=A0AAD4FBR1_9PLEO|nr:hypothetical protein G6011_10136 [Alternaria panax]